MDQYCIDRGTLLDNPSVNTLGEPEKHSLHCLVDVQRCIDSGYSILLPNPAGSPRYGIAVKLDGNGNKQAVQLARSIGRSGSCSTCGSSSSNLTHGFRATFFGELVNDRSPPLLRAKNITTSPKLFNPNGVDDGCPGGATNFNFSLITDSGRFQKPSLAHGSLMIIGWGFLLPSGIIAAHFLKHRPNAIWFKAHRIIQVSGLTIAIAGWIVALATFDVFNTKDTSYVHGTLGMTVMVIGILQPLNAYIRPHPPEDGQPRPFKRLLWEIVHKFFGYVAVVLAAVTIFLGTMLIFRHHNVFRAVWGVALAWVVAFIVGAVWDGHLYKNKTTNRSASKTDDDL